MTIPSLSHISKSVQFGVRNRLAGKVATRRARRHGASPEGALSMAAPGPWASAETLQDVAEATIEWLRGDLPVTPWYAGPPCSETQELTRELIALNRAGLVTAFSQPARPLDETGAAQRAAVAAHTSQRDLLRRVQALAVRSDLIMIAVPYGDAIGYQIPITIDAYRACTWLGFHAPEDDDVRMKALGPGARRELRTSVWIAVIDPVWGRRRYLWQQLRRALLNDVFP
jgi:hypothetical protein